MPLIREDRTVVRAGNRVRVWSAAKRPLDEFKPGPLA